MPLSRSIWRREFPNFPGLPEYMEIFPECGRIVDMAPVKEEPIQYVPMVMSYEEPEPGRVRIRLRADSEWNEYTYRMEGEIIYWTWGGKEWPWEPISDDELPEWFRAREAAARQRFDDREAAAAARKEEEREKGRLAMDS